MIDGDAIQFPQYEPPANPQGIPVADPGTHKPLFKLVKQMLKPRKLALKKPTRPHRRKIRKQFY